MNVTKNINKSIFRGYDIRGINDIDLTEDVAYTIGKSMVQFLLMTIVLKKLLLVMIIEYHQKCYQEHL